MAIKLPATGKVDAKQPQDEPSASDSSEKSQKLSKQYGGTHAGSWVDQLPRSWIPYIQLARLSPPVALLLIYLPHLFGILHASIVYRTPPLKVLRVAAQLLGGSVFFSNAAHAWNDLIDAPIDRLVARTRNRPIASGKVTAKGAFVFAASQALLAASFLIWLPRSTAVATVPTIIGTFYYPWSKLHMYFPQAILGFCLAWGIIVGCAATATSEAETAPWKDPAPLALVLASAFWTMIYDTIYAHQDIEDDLKVGVKSTAVLFRHHTKKFMWACLAIMGASIVAYGRLGALGPAFYLVTFGGCLLSLGTMIARVDLDDQASCWWWFSSGFWLTAASIVGGLVVEYAQVH